jgi:hypothetical protein
MALFLPDNIPIAAEAFKALSAKGVPRRIPPFDQSDAFVLVTGDSSDPHIVWASPSLMGYRSVWNAAHVAGFVDPAGDWGENVDIDHVFPKSWAKLPDSRVTYVRLFPVWAEVNRSAGAGREKAALRSGLITHCRVQGVLYATELQVLKILGHPVGTSSDPVSIFRTRKRKT